MAHFSAGSVGFDLGFERAGMSIRWQVENNEYCNRVLAKYWPNVTRYGDIKAIDWRNVEHVDVVCGGFPCQPFSLAGKRRGAADDRYLWPEVVRCLSEVRPTWFIGENVVGIVNLALEQVCTDLESLGYETATCNIPACAVDAPHQRKRVWIMAYTSCELPHGGRACVTGRTELTDKSRWSAEPDVGVGNDGLSPRLDGGGLSGQTEEGRPDEALCELREPTATENDKRAIGGQGGVSTSEVLQPGLYGPRLCQRCAITYGHVSLAGKKAPWDSLRIVWGYEAAACSSHRRERAKQLSRQHPNLMWQLSHFPPPPCAACWADGSWEAGLTQVAHKIPARVHRLRGLGNAVVPQIPEILGRIILETTNG